MEQKRNKREGDEFTKKAIKHKTSVKREDEADSERELGKK